MKSSPRFYLIALLPLKKNIASLTIYTPFPLLYPRENNKICKLKKRKQILHFLSDQWKQRWFKWIERMEFRIFFSSVARLCAIRNGMGTEEKVSFQGLERLKKCKKVFRFCFFIKKKVFYMQRVSKKWRSRGFLNPVK